MTSENLKRKLAAILSADVKGYSRLMGEDEEWTLRTLNSHRELMDSLFQQHRGKVVGSAGDSVLAEFESVVDAVQCAVEIQQVLKAKNAMLPEARRMEFRIGINLGDVIEEGDSIYGDGVNIAARLESLAEPGGICISGSAFEQIENKLPLKYEYLGDHQVKNISKPIRVYKAHIEQEGASAPAPEEKRPPRKALSRAVLAGLALGLIVGAAVFYLIVFRPWAPKMEGASKGMMAFPLPDKPSIAVLPFANLSGDPKQEFFSDGITEDIITALSKIPKLFVIARNSTFIYKGKAVNVKQVSEELGVRYVLEGSVQKSGDRVRITAQLIDALSGNHLWSERYDRELKDLFALQDEVTLKILTALQVKLTEGEQASFMGGKFRGKEDLQTYLKVWEAAYYLELISIEGNNRCRQIAEEIKTKWPENPWGYLLLGWTHYFDLVYGTTKSPQESLGQAKQLVQKALALDDSNPIAHGLLSHIYCYLKEYDRGIAEGERAVALEPNGALANEFYARSLYYSGRMKEAIPVFQKAIRLNPLGSSTAFCDLGSIYVITGQLKESVSAYKQALRRSPDNLFAHLGLAATYMGMGRKKEARAEAAEALRINPNFTLANYTKGFAYFKDQRKVDQYLSLLRQAGLK